MRVENGIAGLGIIMTYSDPDTGCKMMSICTVSNYLLNSSSFACVILFGVLPRTVAEHLVSYFPTYIR